MAAKDRRDHKNLSYEKKRSFSLSLGALLLAVSVSLAQTEDYAAWSSFRLFSINTTPSGGGAALSGAPLTKFPLLVRLTAANAPEVFAQAKPGGADLRFRRAVGAQPQLAIPVTLGKTGAVAAAQAMQAMQGVATDPQLPYEIERWDSAARTAEIWVLVDSIYANRSNQYIAMHWGKADAPARSNPAAVFDSSRGYVAVWHMGGSSPTAHRSNAVPGGHPAIPSGLNVATGFPVKAGVIGLADTLRGGTGGSLTARQNADHFDLGTGYADFTAGMTISLWVNASPPPAPGYSHFISLGNGAPQDNIWIGRKVATQDIMTEVYNGTTGSGATELMDRIVHGQWLYVIVTGEGPYLTLNYGGEGEVGRFIEITVPKVTRTMAYLGRSLWADPNFAGSVDEVRISRVARDIEWKQMEGFNQKPGSSVVSILPLPLAPNLSSPAANATGVPVYTELAWSYPEIPSRVQLATDSLFTAPLVDTVQISSQRSLGPLAFNTTYYWRVRAQGDAGYSAWTMRRFTTEPAATTVPPAPLLRFPNAFQNQPVSTTLMWYSAGGATSYHVQLSTSSSVASVVVDDSGLAALQRAVGPLPGSTEHFWRVRAKNVHGVSLWSELRAFTTVATIPGIPNLLLPDGFANGVSTIPTLSWESVTGAASYHVQVSTGSGFTTYVLRDSTLTGTSRSIGSPSGAGQLAAFTDYYWKVRAKNAAGIGDWSNIRKFTTGQSVALLSSPAPAPLFATPVRLASGTWLRFGLPRSELVSVRLLDARGQRTAVLWHGPVEAGTHSLALPATSGVRIVEFRAGAFRKTLLVGP
jgi:hypothetical protein